VLSSFVCMQQPRISLASTSPPSKMAEGLTHCWGPLTGDTPSVLFLQDDFTALDQHRAPQSYHANPHVVSNPNSKGWRPPANKAGGSSPAIEFRSTTLTPSQTGTQFDSRSDRSISAFCEECFYCPECSDKSDCESCFDQESCADCLRDCKQCDEMAACPPSLLSMENTHRGYDKFAFSTAIDDTYLTYGDFNYAPSLMLSHVANNTPKEEPEFDDSEFIVYDGPSTSEEQDSVAAQADSSTLLPHDGSNHPTTEIREDTIADTLPAEQRSIDPTPFEFPDLLTGCGTQFENAFATYGGDAFLSTLSPTSIDQIQHHNGGFDTHVDASLLPSSAQIYKSAIDSGSGYPVPAMPLIPQSPFSTTLPANITQAQPRMTSYDAGTIMPLNLQGYLGTAMSPAFASTQPTAHPDLFGNVIQVGLSTQASSTTLPPQGSSGLPFPGSGPYGYPTHANYPPPEQQPYVPAYPAPTPTNTTLASLGPGRVGGSQTAPAATATRLCTICNKGPFDASALAKHKNSARCQKAAGKTPVGKYTCPYCAHAYPRQDHLKRHLLKIIRADHSVKPPTCEDLRARDANGQIEWETEKDPKTGRLRRHDNKGAKCCYQMPRAYKQYMQNNYGGRHGQ